MNTKMARRARREKRDSKGSEVAREKETLRGREGRK